MEIFRVESKDITKEIQWSFKIYLKIQSGMQVKTSKEL